MNTTFAAALSVNDLHVTRPDGVTLLRGASFELYPAEIVLLVGGIGTGKSTLMRILAGLLANGQSGWTIGGTLTTPRRTADLGRDRVNAGAMVFQGSALFDDLSIAENLKIAASHTSGRSDVVAAFAGSLIDSIRPDGATNLASGGERQLVAIARTVLAGHSVLLFDEPNSGLDPQKTIRLADTLRTIKREIGCPMIIAAHHIRHLLPIADRVIFLDQEAGLLVPLATDTGLIEERLCRSVTPPATVGITGLSGETLVEVHSKLFWQWQFFRRYAWSLCLSPEALLYMALGGVLIGFVSTWFSFTRFPNSNYLTPMFEDDMLSGLGFAQFRVLVPLVMAILLASRSAAIIAADLGHRVYSNQLDAMQNLKIPRHAYLSANILAACLVAAVVGVALMFVVAASVSMLTWHNIFPEAPIALWRENFFALMFRGGGVLPDGSAWVLTKTVVCAAAVSITSIKLGLAAKRSTIDLHRGIAVSVVLTVALVLCVHTGAAILEF